MRFNEHSRYAGRHSRLSPSSPSWLNYSNDKMIDRLRTMEAAARGTREHAFASEAISLGHRLQGKKTISMYVNDAIGHKMTPEQLLFVSDNCFGTCDAISFRDGKLRIHDLKTGTTPAHWEQLIIYAAMFCMEYKMKPYEIEIELRIYQGGERLIYIPDPKEIADVMDTIVRLDRVIEKKLQEALA